MFFISHITQIDVTSFKILQLPKVHSLCNVNTQKVIYALRNVTHTHTHVNVLNEISCCVHSLENVEHFGKACDDTGQWTHVCRHMCHINDAIAISHLKLNVVFDLERERLGAFSVVMLRVAIMLGNERKNPEAGFRLATRCKVSSSV